MREYYTEWKPHYTDLEEFREERTEEIRKYKRQNVFKNTGLPGRKRRRLNNNSVLEVKLYRKWTMKKVVQMVAFADDISMYVAADDMIHIYSGVQNKINKFMIRH